MRGKETTLVISDTPSGITPAYAGKRYFFCLFSWNDKDHPRVCGEKVKDCLFSQMCKGSPPRVRGKVAAPRQPCGAARITPACAGKSDSVNGVAPPFWDHPRICGEKQVLGLIGAYVAGSPPRVRGKAPQRHRGEKGGRITPACAGKSMYLSKSSDNSEDHPRVCGEKGRCTGLPAYHRGSPPRVRGKVPSSI